MAQGLGRIGEKDMKEDKVEIITLSSREHILNLPGMYIGSVSPQESQEWILENNQLLYKKVVYAQGLLKIINEVIDNSLDEGIKTDWKYSNKISVKIQDNEVVVEDNGRGIPVEQNSAGEWLPVIAVCNARTGSNFNDEERTSIGTHGLGVKATNIFSKSFECVTCDKHRKIKIKCKNNLEEEKHTVSDSNGDKTGTRVTFTPDYRRFGIDEMPEEILNLIRTRLSILSWFFPKCDFKFNGEKVALKAKDISALLPEPSISLNSDNIFILVYPSEDPYTLTYVNGISLRRGGSHIDHISSTLVSDIREKLSKKYKSIKPADIRNRLGLVVFFRNFPDCKFDSQTKETLTNSLENIRDFLKDVDLTAKLSSKILREKAFVENITELYKLKEELRERKDLQKLSKKKTVDSDKYFPPIAHSGRKYFCITEGQSAYSGISKVLGRRGIGYYAIQGKILNIQDLTPSKFMQNQEVQDIINILGIELDNPETDMIYEKVIITSDQDMDGFSIAGLLITLFNKVAPNLVQQGRICRLNTPLLIGLNGNRVIKYFFDFPDSSKLDKRLKWKYLKGLGSWNKDKLDQVIAKEGGLEGLILQYHPDKKAAESINNWFGDNSDIRKDALRGREFHIDMI